MAGMQWALRCYSIQFFFISNFGKFFKHFEQESSSANPYVFVT